MKKWMPLVLIAACLMCGCVERRIYLVSDPPGADVYVDGEPVGRTRPADHKDGPFYVNFVYYGPREFTFRKPGFETVSKTVKLDAPWYEYPPIDFFAEVLVPWNIVDEHNVDVKLAPAKPADLDQLLQSAEQFRKSSGMAPPKPDDKPRGR